MDPATRQTVDDLLDALAPLSARVRAMFGGYCVYVDDKVVGIVGDGQVFIKTSRRDDLLEPVATLAPAYPGAKDSWLLPNEMIRDDPERLCDIVREVAASVPARRAKPG